MAAKILWIQGKRDINPSFIPGLRKKGYDLVIVPTGAQALSHLYDTNPDIVVVNAASMRSNGSRICKSLSERIDGLPILVIAEEETVYSTTICANQILSLPFTIRKLNNRIQRILPGEGSNLLREGPIQLDLERKRVRCQDRESRLTPRLILLLKLFLENHGEVLQRESIFKEIWETEYLGDTRTLDVHISWLRQAIEKDPRKPRYLKTIRGIGYRLDV